MRVLKPFKANHTLCSLSPKQLNAGRVSAAGVVSLSFRIASCSAMAIMKRQFIRPFASRFWCWLLLPTVFANWSVALADRINLSGAEVAPNVAEIRVQEDGVLIALEVFPGDVAEFADLLPRTRLPEDIQAAVEPDDVRLARFARDGLSVRDGKGQNLSVDLRLIEPRTRIDRRSPFAGTIDVYSGRRYPAPPDDPRVIYAELFYAFDGTQPASLTLAAPLRDDGKPSVVVGMIVFHRDVPVIDFRYLGEPVTLNLNWEDPWFSRFENPNLSRHHRDAKMSFLYAEAYEIRHEVLVRVRDALELTNMRARGDVLSEDEAARLVELTASEIGSRSPMTIDGQSVTADFDRASFLRIGLRGLELRQPGEAVNVDAGILGLIWSVPTDGMPKQASVEWTLFEEPGEQVQGYAIDAAGPMLAPMTPEDPVLVWTNHFKKPPVPPVTSVDAAGVGTIDVPALSVAMWVAALLVVICALRHLTLRRVAIGAATAIVCMMAGIAAVPFGTIAVGRPSVAPAVLADEDATRLTHELLSNVYRAFDFRGEGQVYDRLAKTVDGGLLEQVYLDQRRGLRIERAGGAESRVDQVMIKSASPSHVTGTATEFVVRTNWQVVGSVGHWGHIHQRANAYEADITISAESGDWKIIGFDVLSLERLS